MNKEKKEDVYYSVFMPFYNEETIVKKNAQRVIKELRALKRTFELVLIDDNSTDDSLQQATELAKKEKEVKILHYEKGPSRRENLAKSFLQARGKIVAYMDYDLATSLTHLKRLLNEAETCDVVIGSRYKKESHLQREWWRLLISKVYNFTIRLLFGTQISDHQCGFKAFQQKTIRKLVRKLGYDSKFQRGWFWDVSLLVYAKKMQFCIKEIPVTWQPGEKTSFSFKRELKMIPQILRLYWQTRKLSFKKVRENHYENHY